MLIVNINKLRPWFPAMPIPTEKDVSQTKIIGFISIKRIQRNTTTSPTFQQGLQDVDLALYGTYLDKHLIHQYQVPATTPQKMELHFQFRTY